MLELGRQASLKLDARKQYKDSIYDIRKKIDIYHCLFQDNLVYLQCKKTTSGFTGDYRVGVCKYGRLFWEQV